MSRPSVLFVALPGPSLEHREPAGFPGLIGDGLGPSPTYWRELGCPPECQ